MAEQPPRPAGSIYDLGYRSYTGDRLGRTFAIYSLYVFSLRTIFGLSRSWLSKLFPIGLGVVALIPALVQLAIAAVAPLDLELIEPESYFGFVAIVVALFCAVAAPEIVGRDQRTQTLSLYFSRTLSRMDYLAAKFLALMTALMLVLATPQLLLLVGRAVAADDLVDSLKDNVGDLLPALAGSALASALMGGVALAIASQTSRRAFATGAVLAYFAIFSALGSILFEIFDGDGSGYALMLSPFAVLTGAIYWLFNVPPPIDSELALARIEGIVFFGVACAYIAVSLGLLIRRISRMQA